MCHDGRLDRQFAVRQRTVRGLLSTLERKHDFMQASVVRFMDRIQEEDVMKEQLEFLPGLRFACSCCGRCCQQWGIEVSAAEKERLEKLDWSKVPEAPPREQFFAIWANHPSRAG